LIEEKKLINLFVSPRKLNLFGSYSSNN